MTSDSSTVVLYFPLLLSRFGGQGSMKLMTKFNLILLVLFGVSGILISQMAHSFLTDNARREVLQEAEVLMASAEAARDYMADTMGPLLLKIPAVDREFHPEVVPNVSAIAMFTKLRKRHPDYGYRAVALNPRNLDNRASCWEEEIITWLRDHPDQSEKTGVRESVNERSLYLAKPIRMDPSCVECHSVPAMAQDSMIAKYGPSNGFGWKVDDIVAAEIVSVPMSVPLEIAKQAYHKLLFYMGMTLIFTIVALDAGVYWLVIRPLQVVSETADRVSTGEKDVPALKVKGNDEIASVTAAVNRMRVSLAKALKLLE